MPALLSSTGGKSGWSSGSFMAGSGGASGWSMLGFGMSMGDEFGGKSLLPNEGGGRRPG